MNFTYEQAVIIGFIQGLTELFPISSLGHAILIPAWIGGSFREFISEENQAYLLITIAIVGPKVSSVIALQFSGTSAMTTGLTIRSLTE